MLSWLRKLYIAVVLFPISLMIKCFIPIFKHLIKVKGLDPDADYHELKHKELVAQLESAFGEPPVVNRLVKLEEDGHSFGIIKRTISPKRSISAVSGPMKYPTATDISDDEIKEIAEEMYDIPHRMEDLPSACFSKTYSSPSEALKDVNHYLDRLEKEHGKPQECTIENLRIEFDEEGVGRAKVASEEEILKKEDAHACMVTDGYNYTGYSTYLTGEPPLACSMDYQPLDLHKEFEFEELDLPNIEITEEDLENWKSIFAEAVGDPDFKILTKKTSKTKKPAKSKKKPAKKASSKKKK